MPDIEWCGQVTEHKWELFSRIDFFIVPSLEESSSLVTIEAAMLGKPVIVTSHVGAKYLADNNGGFIFEPGDKTALRNLIGRCIDMSEGEYRRMGRQIRLNYEKTSTFPIYHKELSSINFASTREKPEFDGWRWVSYWYPIRQVVNFKRDVYRRVLTEFSGNVIGNNQAAAVSAAVPSGGKSC